MLPSAFTRQQTVSSQTTLNPSEHPIILSASFTLGIFHIITCIMPFPPKTHRALNTLQELINIPQIPCFALTITTPFFADISIVEYILFLHTITR